MVKRNWFFLALAIACGAWLANQWVVSVTEEEPTVSIPPVEPETPRTPTLEQPVWNDPEGDYARFLVRGGAFHVLVDDLTGDGRKDLAFTSHSGNMIRVFRQVAPRRFEATDEQDITGFHPYDTIALPDTPNRYLIHAEGYGQLRVVAARPDGGLTLISGYPLTQPLGSVPFTWPDWGPLSLAVAPFSGFAMTLLRDFDPEKGEVKAALTIPAGQDPRPARLTDLQGDGVPDLVFPSFFDNKIWVIEYPGAERTPEARELAVFAEGWPRHVVPFDVNQNGKMDLLVPMSVWERIAVLLNDGQGNFTEDASIPYPGRIGIHTLAVGQDRGGRYLLAGGSHALVLYREREAAVGSFETILLPILNWPNRVELVDVDGDGWLDAVVANQGPLESQVIYGPLWEVFGKLAANPPDKVALD